MFSHNLSPKTAGEVMFGSSDGVTKIQHMPDYSNPFTNETEHNLGPFDYDAF